MDTSYTVLVSRAAKKSLESTPGKMRERTIVALEELRADPHGGSSKLKGRLKGLYRKRVGNFRVVMRIDDKVRRVFVLSISDRRESYRKQ